MKRESLWFCKMPRLLGVLVSQLFHLAPFIAMAGPGHDHAHDFPRGGQSGVGGPIFLTESQRRNLGITVVEAEIREMGRTVEVPATLVVPPERHGVVSAPFAGRISEVLVKLGQNVVAGEPVLRVRPLAVGSPTQTLTAPVGGHVIRQNAMPGSAFTPETALVEIGDDSELLAGGVFFQSPMLPQIQLGKPATFLVDLYPGEAFLGTLQRIDTGHGPDDPSFHIYAVIANPDHRLRPNYRGRLSIPLEEPQTTVAVPRRALLGLLGNLSVFVENEEGAFEKREVVVGLRDQNWVEIIEGILPGERVVTVGNYQLQFVAPRAGPNLEGDHGHTH
jgi:multidrug efflux pump subunit AcrA (membrane-fusion protein)